jgi:succinyl-diaminopimelate desuccinylase
MANFPRICQNIDTQRDAMIALQQRLIAAPALGPDNGGDGEWEKSLVVRDVLAGMTDKIEEYHAADARVSTGKRPNLVAYIPGESSTRRLWLLAHLDVVPPGDESEWSTPPFEGVVKEGKIFGRGAEDNHHGLVSALFAAKAFTDLGIRPAIDIGLLMLSDEETGNAFGIQHVLSTAPTLFGPDDLIIVPDGGPPSGDMIETAEKSGLWIHCTVVGEQTHASTPHAGSNAHRAAAHLVVALEALHTQFSESDPLFAPNPTSTFEPTWCAGNAVSLNIIPGRAEFAIDCRVLPSQSLDDILSMVQQFGQQIGRDFRVTITVKCTRQSPAPPPTPSDAPIVTQLSAALRAVYGVEAQCYGHGGGSLAKPLREQGLSAVVFSRTDETMHTPNEYCVIDYLLGDAKAFAHVAAHAETT